MADEKIFTNIGHATAYAYAKSKGYTGSEDQFATDQANFAANAQQVREDKESVEATVATFDNTTVPAAVQTVTAEGTRQVGIVGTAGETQVARVQAEGTTQVGVVQTEGTTQKNAVQAKGDEVIASIPSDYTELTEEVEDLKSSIADVNDYALNAYATDTASGAIATFPDGADDIPIKSLSVAIEPVQDLHGQDAPYPAGCGKNLLDPAKRTTYGSGLGQRWYATDGITLKANQPYTMSVTSSTSIFVYFIDKVTDATLLSGSSPQTYTPTEDVVVYLQAYSNVDISSIDTFQLELGSTATDYAPYSNICPISGHTSANVTRCGKNLLDLSEWLDKNGYADYSVDADGWVIIPNIGASTTYSKPYSLPTEITGSVRILVDSNRSTATNIRIGILKDGAGIAESNSVIENRSFDAVRINYSSGGSATLKIMVNMGATADEWKPYTADTYPITFPSGTGTVYGGNITVNQDGSGTLVVDRKIVDLGDLYYNRTASGLFSYSYLDNSLQTLSEGNLGDAITDIYTFMESSPISGNNPDYYYHFAVSGAGALYISDPRYTDTSAFKTAMSGHKIVYKLKTPLAPIPLTASQITTLLGTNSLFADCNGDVSVIYRADTAMYIAKKIAEALA